jgi:hypothetical protein
MEPAGMPAKSEPGSPRWSGRAGRLGQTRSTAQSFAVVSGTDSENVMEAKSTPSTYSVAVGDTCLSTGGCGRRVEELDVLSETS